MSSVCLNSTASPLILNAVESSVALSIYFIEPLSFSLFAPEVITPHTQRELIGAGVHLYVCIICDRTWEKGPLHALLQNRLIGIQR